MIEELQCRALLFDLDGVLVDSLECVEAAWRRWSDGHGLEWARVHDILPGRRGSEVIRMCAPDLDAWAEVDSLVAFESKATQGLRIVPGARELIEKLPGDQWGVVTSGYRSVALHRLRFAGLPEPAVLVTAEDVRNGKPEPEGYLAAAEKLMLMPHDCVVVEDAAVGIVAAERAEMASIGITNGKNPEELKRATMLLNRLSHLDVELSGSSIFVTRAQRSISA
jgi:sugar-phosphatase